jgi:hypothetical protein
MRPLQIVWLSALAGQGRYVLAASREMMRTGDRQ